MGDFTIPRLRLRWALVLSLAILAATAAILLWMGRDAGLSPHLADRYTYNHLLHGAIFYWLLWAVFRGRLSIAARLVIAVTIEGAWEIWENTPFAIARYRSQTISPGFTRDSVIDSMGDMLAMILGFLLASRLPAWVTVVLLVVAEGVLLYLIRDSLLVNVVMLLYPLDWIREWQAGK